MAINHSVTGCPCLWDLNENGSARGALEFLLHLQKVCKRRNCGIISVLRRLADEQVLHECNTLLPHNGV